MRDFRQRLAAQGINGFPPNYQVVIRCTTSGLRLIRYQYQTHVIVDRPLDPGSAQ
ncbi:MAG TPA: hypothetical protein VMH28_14385 [Candidatus Acidoferrales bacterium]|nr:hypothetical protein [Candidatus Acidoferrales bacterium]